MVSSARATAFDVLMDVQAGGYASDVLMRRSALLDTRDAGLASELVFGCLRRQAQLDFALDHAAGRSLSLDVEVRIALRMGAYQILHLDRVPRRAAVSESVELVKKARKRSAAGLVNAILRKLDTEERPPWPDRATKLSCPEWLLRSWAVQWDDAVAEGIASAALQRPDTWVRSTEPASNLEPAELAGCYRLMGGSPPPGARIQDIGSQSVVPLLDLRPGHRFLDLCAAPGNKTAQALETPLDAVACDLHWSRIRQMSGMGAVLLVADASGPLPFAHPFDRILVDAPCTGTGTLGRNPEIKWRLRPGDPARLAPVQAAILRNALALLGPAGRCVYSTCSLEREENRDVVDAVLRPESGFRLVCTLDRIPGREPGDGFFAAAIEREWV